MLAAAVVLGLFAVLIATFMQRPAAPVAKTATNAVGAAAAPFSFGDKITADKLKVVQLPPDASPAVAYRSVAAAVAVGKRVAQRSIALNETIVPTAVSPVSNRLSNVGVIQPLMRAVSLNVTESSDVGGLVAPGDHVDVYVTRTPPEHAPHTEVSLSEHALQTLASGKTSGAAFNPAASSAGFAHGGPHASVGPSGATPGLKLARNESAKPEPITDLLVQDVRVLALGQNTGVNSAKIDLVKTATLEVSPEQAAKLMLGQQAGTLSLALRGASDVERSVLPSLRTQDLHDGPPIHVAVASHRRRGPSGKTASAVEIIRAGTATSYSVPQ